MASEKKDDSHDEAREQTLSRSVANSTTVNISVPTPYNTQVAGKLPNGRTLLPGHGLPIGRDGVPYYPNARPVNERANAHINAAITNVGTSAGAGARPVNERSNVHINAAITNVGASVGADARPVDEGENVHVNAAVTNLWTEEERILLLLHKSRGVKYQEISNTYIPRHSKNACENQMYNLKKKYGGDGI